MNKPITREKLLKLIRLGKDITKVNTSEITNMQWVFSNARSFNH
jgi:hypothetical protein